MATAALDPTTREEEILLSKIRLDGGTQAREVDRYDDTIAEYRLNIDVLPPIDVFDDAPDEESQGNYWLADGFQRYFAHDAEGRISIKCIVHKGSQRDAVLFAVGANSTHGLRRNHNDVRRAIKIMLADKEWGTASDRFIAEKCKVSHTLVAKVRKEFKAEQTAEIGNGCQSSDEPEKRRGKDGVTRTVPTRQVASESFDEAPEDEVYEHDEPEEVVGADTDDDYQADDDAPQPECSEPDSWDTPEADERYTTTEAAAGVAEDDEVLDEVGTLAEGEARTSLLARAQYREWIKQLSALKRDVESAYDRPGGEWIVVPRMTVMFDNLITTLKESMPYAVHPACGGDGCRDCRNSGVITKSAYLSLERKTA